LWGDILRSEQEIFDLILGIAKADQRVRAVYMNGSRANPKIQKDIYQDYDIVFVVTETKSFLNKKDWISLFGEIAIVQEPDNNDFGWGIQANFDRSYTWLILFKDGVRIDLNIQIKEVMLEKYTSDSLTIPLLDKDNCLPEIPASNDKDYHIKKPTVSQYKGCCNEFWWCLNNVAKGIVRDQLPYAMWMYNVIVRDMLVKMIDWYIGINNDFSVSVGMSGKYYKNYLAKEMYDMYAKTYSDSDYNNMWSAIYISCELFRKIAQPVAAHLGYTYNITEDRNIIEYLNKVQKDSLNIDL
jgi:aminoglycoside 6-adenylyltransferase